jgi:hypothetical protein
MLDIHANSSEGGAVWRGRRVSRTARGGWHCLVQSWRSSAGLLAFWYAPLFLLACSVKI